MRLISLAVLALFMMLCLGCVRPENSQLHPWKRMFKPIPAAPTDPHRR